MMIKRRMPSLLTASLLLAFTSFTVHADDDEHEGRARIPLLPKYQQECSACHVAYPPGMLPAASWQRLMNGLPKHFGTDASLDAATTKALSTWLTANAGSRSAPPQDRITQSSWFLHEHDEVPTRTWQRVSIKSPANCAACHTRADQGDFNERFIRIPR
ncbi:MAG: diheme cytochrome c [Aquabacterium sp.]|nr:diheme cytochrome c [Aquabacterium sp.]